MERFWLHRYAILLAVCTLFLVVAGASVTSKEAGLSVPDWPLSYGQVMPEMRGGVFFEHGHRMVATTVGFMTIILAVWLALVETRSWMKKLGFVTLGAVTPHGFFGGLPVTLMAPPRRQHLSRLPRATLLLDHSSNRRLHLEKLAARARNCRGSRLAFPPHSG